MFGVRSRPEVLRETGNCELKRRHTYRPFGILLVLAAAAFSCNVSAQAVPPDLVILNAKIRTLTSPNAVVGAMAVTGDRITAVGSDRSIRRMVGPSTRVIDAEGYLVIPGFNDAHVHFNGIGNSFSSIDLSASRSVAEITARIAHYLRFLPKRRWILGRGWSTIPPRLADIDAISTDNPVFIYSADGKTAFANTAAYKLSGLRAEQASNWEGLVTNGILQRIAHVVPRDHTSNLPDIVETATNYAASLGVTSVQDMHSDDNREIYRELQRRGRLKTRVYDCVSLPDWKKFVPSQTAKGDMVRSGCLKGFSDGDAAYTPKLLRDVQAADKAGFQVMVHAVGNSANEIVLAVFEQVTKANGIRDRRFRVEHAHNPKAIDLSRFSRSNIIASMQPYLFHGSGGGFYETLSEGKIAFGSDAAITDFDPLLGIQAAVTAGAESLSVYEAVRAYTLGSAYAEFQEKEKGTIQVGKLADVVILSRDIFEIDPAAITSARVVMTIVGGKGVYEKWTNGVVR